MNVLESPEKKRSGEDITCCLGQNLVFHAFARPMQPKALVNERTIEPIYVPKLMPKLR